MTRHFAWVCLAGLSGVALGSFVRADDRPIPPLQTLANTVVANDASHDLALAATCLERGEEAAAVAYLSRFVADHPDQPLVRVYLAELFWRREQLSEARGHYERVLADAHLVAFDAARMIQVHTRLMAIAQRDGDAYAEHLHRGIGLYLIGRQTASEGVVAAEGVLCKAAGELMQALRERPEEARPHWYLYLVWSRLGQSLPAIRSLRCATDLADNADLTPSERRDLALATVVEARRK